jgi:hypothetical protein
VAVRDRTAQIDGAKSTCAPLALLGERPQLVPTAHASVAGPPAALTSDVNIVDSNIGGSSAGGSSMDGSNNDDSSTDGSNNYDNSGDDSDDSKDGNSDDNMAGSNGGGNSKLAECQSSSSAR